ncbi:MAG TPA: AAA family ATPase [Plasticicumulans sp.]|nr:AAA family ATPase [Plasticicumulans sp.]HMX53110.1 AAA family ATPase [Plasticicumulans sp.]
MSKITRITVRGYKSIRALEAFELRDLNVLIGANGAGKSNFISLFRLLTAVSERRLQLYVQKQGGPDALLHRGRKHTEHMEYLVELDKYGYFAQLEATADNRLIFSDERIVAGSVNRRLGVGHAETGIKRASSSTGIQLVNKSIIDSRVFHFHDTSDNARIKQIHHTHINLRLLHDAANLAAFLLRLRKDYPDFYLRIVETIRLAATFFGDFVHREPVGESTQLEWTEYNDPDTPLKAHMLSDGTLRFICLTTLLLQPTELLPDTLLIDEPELGLHPYAIALLANMLREASETTQLIISTQSVELLNHFNAEDVIVVDRINDESVFRRLDTESLHDWLQDYSLGELWKQNVLGGRPSR